MNSSSPRSLTKKLFLAHARCPKLAWWLAHEPDAPETRETVTDRVRLRQGAEVGILARSYLPEHTQGHLVERGGRSLDSLCAETGNALRQQVPVIYEGAFTALNATIFTDALLRENHRWTLIEVKSSTSVTDNHVAEGAFQAAILRAAGVGVERVEIMHLNRECRYPDLLTLFLREDVTDRAIALGPMVLSQLTALEATIHGPLPATEIGEQCSTPDDCPFKSRCWPPIPDHHVSTLYRVQKKKVQEYINAGYHTVHDLPDGLKLSVIAARQRRAVREGTIVVEREALTKALAQLRAPVAHLDFETVQLPIPCWPGCRPYDHVPVQVSCHVVAADGTVAHYDWIADGPEDPRRAVAETVLTACRGAGTVTAYFASFEQGRLRELAEACPDLADELITLADQIVDLLPIIRDTVYHPEFGGSFSLKKVLPALVPTLTYDDIEIREGGTASAELLRLMFGTADCEPDERERLRAALLAYCERDTEAMVVLSARLAELC